MKAPRIFAALMALAAISEAGPTGGAWGAAPLPNGPKAVGKIDSNENGPGFLTAGQKVGLVMDGAAVARGDTLDIYEQSTDDGRQASRVGSLSVISRSGEPPRGMIVRMSRELENSAYVGFALPRDIQMSRYLPFIRKVADAYVDAPGLRPVNLAFLGVVNEYGERQEWSTVIAKSAARDFCARPQFRCVDANAVGELLWETGARDIRTIPKAAQLAIRAGMGVDIYVTGHVRRDSNGAEILLSAKPTSSSASPGGLWMRRRFSGDELAGFSGGSETAMDGARLRIRLVSPENIEGMGAEYVFHEATAHGDNAERLEPAGRFVEIDGRRFRPGADGTLFDGAVAPGRRRITFGFYSTARKGATPDAPSHSDAKLFARSVEIPVARGERAGLDVAMMETGEFRLIAADAYTIEE